MKPIAIAMILLCLVYGTSGPPSSHGQQSMAAPAISLPETQHLFSPAVDGTFLSHDFVIENKGDAPLIIEKVVSSCGCTAAYFDRQIPPAGLGRVTVKVDTTGYGGGKMAHTLEVYTNDPVRPVSPLAVSGDVLEFARLSKRIVRLNGKPGSAISDVVEIEPVHPFKISGVTAYPGEHIRVGIRDAATDGTPKYRLTVESTTVCAGRFFEKIVVRTDSDVKPEFTIPVQGQISDG